MPAVGVNLPCLLTPTQAMGSCRQAVSSQTCARRNTAGQRAGRFGQNPSQRFPLQSARVELGPCSALGSQLSSGHLLN